MRQRDVELLARPHVSGTVNMSNSRLLLTSDVFFSVSSNAVPTPSALLSGLDFSSLWQNLEMPNPFFDKDEAAPGMTPAAIGYRYRKFQLG